MFEFKTIMKNQRSSSIFSQESEEDPVKIRAKKRFSRDFSDKTITYGQYRNQNSESPYLRPSDHSVSDLFGDFPSDFYRKDIKGFYKTQVLKPKNNSCDYTDKIHNYLPLYLSNATQKYRENFKNNKKSATFNKKFEEKITKNCLNYLSFNEKKENAITECLTIKGLGPNDDESTLKSLCQGLHIVKIQTENDNLTGKCLGKATLQIRSHTNSNEIHRFKLKLVEKGYFISSFSSVKGKKNNYSSTVTNFLDSKIQNEEKKCILGVSSKERKRINLATSDDLFGNSPGTGKWEKKFENQINLKQNHENIENFRKWEMVKNAKFKIKAPRNPNSGFL